MHQKNIKLGDIVLWTETFGDSNNPAVLLIGGSGCQAIFWPEEFCKEIANNGFFVIRYDHRDTGLSSCIDYKKDPYSLDDLMKDAVGILDHLCVSKAHLVGFSMGGYIVQLLSIYFPKRVLSVTSLASTCDNSSMHAAFKNKNTTDFKLPPPTKAFIKMYLSDACDIKDRIDAAKILNGGHCDFNEAYYVEYAKQVIKRSRPLKTSSNHSRASGASILDRSALLKNVMIPYLIIHGDSDPAFPLEHAKFMKNVLPKATLAIIEGMGHSLNPLFHQQLLRLIIEHLNLKHTV